MLIPKSKMPILINALDLLLAQDEDRPEGEEDLVKQIRDRCALCLHGDAPFLEVDVSYVNIINRDKIGDCPAA